MTSHTAKQRKTIKTQTFASHTVNAINTCQCKQISMPSNTAKATCQNNLRVSIYYVMYSKSTSHNDHTFPWRHIQQVTRSESDLRLKWIPCAGSPWVCWENRKSACIPAICGLWRSRILKVWTKLGQIGHKWDKPFQIKFKYTLTRSLIWKGSRFVPFVEVVT